jgi:hypothetical protein
MKDIFFNDDSLQDWDDFDDTPLHDDEQNQCSIANKDACRALYKKWAEIIFMLKGLHMEDDVLPDNVHHATGTITELMVADATVVHAKIRGCYNATTYYILMENAAIIRSDAQAVKSRLLALEMMDKSSATHVAILRKEIDEFRFLFRDWVSNFKKDGIEDEWGLF